MKNILRSIIKSMPPLYRSINRLRGWRLHNPDWNVPFISVGGGKGSHNYGAWAIPEGVLHDQSIIYSVGVGGDISFDLELIQLFGCKIQAFDPTPMATKFIQDTNTTTKFVFHQIGLADKDESARFDSPSSNSTSFSLPIVIDEENNDGEFFPVRRLETLMQDLGHKHVNLLKMDIEGFEYSVIDDILGSNILPDVMLVEFHHFQRGTPQRTRDSVEKLRAAGYKIFWISDLGAEYGFLRIQ